jgi:predicted ester cyclase
MSDTDDYRQKLERLYSATVGGDLGAVDDIVHVEYTYHGAGMIGPDPGREGLKATIQASRAALSDARLSIEDLILERDRSVVRYRVRGTHTGELLGAPATGHDVDYSGIAIYRWAQGKIIEEWDCFEETKLLTALGLLPGVQPSEG